MGVGMGVFLPGERYNPHPLDLEITLLPPSGSKHTLCQETELKKKKKKNIGSDKIQTLPVPSVAPWLSALIPVAKVHDLTFVEPTISPKDASQMCAGVC